MQTAVQTLPTHLMPSYQRPSISSVVNRNSTILPTPPVGTRKRKRAHQYTVSYSEVQEVDTDGRLREIIVIEDTPPPPTASPATSSRTNGYSASYQPPAYSAPIRTRARAAMEAQADSSGSLSAAHPIPAPKKRKRELDEVPSSTKKGFPPTHAASSTANHATWINGSAATSATTPKQPVSCDDKEGHYIVTPDDIIYKRYRTVRLLGQGTFGKVVEAVDIETNKRVAIKIIRAIQKYREASRIEVRVLQKLKERDPSNRHKCIHLLNWFDYRNHICLVSELLGICVYDFLKENDFTPFPRDHIQSFAQQLLGSVAFLHDLHIIHTDLKPENILLVRNDFRTVTIPTSGKRHGHRSKRILDSTDIRLIDFGSATFQDEYHSAVVATRHYRAPEIILGLGWSYPCDAYSLGCILVEFYTGMALFQTHDNLEHLAMMEMVMGKMPENVAREAVNHKPEFFKDGPKLNWPSPKTTKQSRKDVRATRSLQEIIPQTDMINVHFLDLVRKLLMFDPKQRITVREALRHPYFSQTIPPEL
ncbi:Protein kinase-like domain containing protein [Russula decolorans]